MANGMSDEYIRSSPLDMAHFALGFAGLIFALAGVTITSIRVVVLGLLLLAWALAYFFTERR